MNIYIYGSKSFRNDVHDELDHSNIKFKMDNSSSIIDVKNLEDLKHLVAHNKEDVFLIDDAKIIKKDALNGKFTSKLKFLIPKDGIEEEFLFEHGVGDISFDSIDELSKHITDKIQKTSEQDDSFDNRDEIQESISNIVNDAYEEDDAIKLNDELSSLLVSNDGFDEHETEHEKEELDEFASYEPQRDTSNDADELLDDLMNLEVSNEDFETPTAQTVSSSDDIMQQLEELSISNDDFEPQDSKKKNSMSELSDIEDQLNDISITNTDFNGTISNDESELTQQSEDIQGDFMAGDFSSLDDINENDIIAALNGEEVAISETQVLTSTKKNEPVSLNINNTDDISELLSKLLKNKTLEITVKIKD